MLQLEGDFLEPFDCMLSKVIGKHFYKQFRFSLVFVIGDNTNLYYNRHPSCCICMLVEPYSFKLAVWKELAFKQ